MYKIHSQSLLYSVNRTDVNYQSTETHTQDTLQALC